MTAPSSSPKFLRFAATLLAASSVLAFPAWVNAQATPATKPATTQSTPATAQAAARAKWKAAHPTAVPPQTGGTAGQGGTAQQAGAPTQPVTPTAKAAAQPGATPASVVMPPAQTTPAATSAGTVTPTVQPAVAQTKTRSSGTRNASSTTASQAGTGTLAWGAVAYTPAGCVHNGTKAICTFTLVNRGNAVTLPAVYQMNILQFVDDAHVPHGADSTYFVDSYGTVQGQLFVNPGGNGTLIKEFPNVDARVASGEFHLQNQVVGGINVSAPGAAPAQGPTVATNPGNYSGAQSLTWGTVAYTPAGCVHNGNKAVCTFTLVNRGNAVTLPAVYQMNVLQFVDDAHVPHGADSTYFVDSYGTVQGQLFVNPGGGGTLVKEFPNVDARVANGEFHLQDQVIGGINVGAPGSIPAQAPTVAGTSGGTQPAAQPSGTASNTPATDPTNKVQQGIDQVNSKKQKAIDTWNKLKGLGK